jgi:hypothetical protein
LRDFYCARRRNDERSLRRTISPYVIAPSLACGLHIAFDIA